MTTKQERQDAVEFVMMWMVVQGRPAVKSKDGACSYRTKEGRMCAVGCTISDHDVGNIIALGMNGATVDGAWHLMPNHVREDIEFWADMQHAHDWSARQDDFLGEYARKMRRLCDSYELRYPEEILG